MTEEVIFKVGVDTGNTVGDLDKVEQELKNIDKAGKAIGGDVSARFDELNKKVASGTLTMRESTRAVKEYQTIALQAGRESPIGQEAIKRAGELTDTLSDLRNEVTRTGTDGANMQASLQLGSGIVAGYGALQGVQALLGEENEDLAKSFVKLQAIQSVLAGIEQIRAVLEKESFLMQKAKIVTTKIQTAVEMVYASAVGATTGAMKALRLAMLAIPIVALIAGIVALAVGINYLIGTEKKAEAQNEALTRSYERQQEAFERGMAIRKRESQNAIDLAKARGESEEEVHALEIKQIKDNEVARRKTINEEKRMVVERNKALQQALLERNEDLANQIKDEMKAHKQKYNELKMLDGQYKVDLELKEQEFKNQQKEEEESARKEAKDRWKSANEARKREQEEENKKRIEMERAMQDLLAVNIEDADKRAVVQLAIKHQREKEEIISKYGEQSELIKQLEEKQKNETLSLLDEQDKAYDEAQKLQGEKERADAKLLAESKLTDERAHLEAKLINLVNEFEQEQEIKKELAELEMEQALLNEALLAGEKEKIIAEYNEKVRAIDEETVQHKKELDAESVANAIEWAEKGLEAITAVGDAYFTNKLAQVEKGSKAEEDLARKQFKFNKALQLGGAIMDSAKAVIASLASSPIAIGAVPNPAGIASLAFVGATSIANIAKILATKFEGGASSGGGSVSPPTINSSTPQTPTPNEGQSTLTAGLQGSGQSNKVYVVEHEITSQQKQSNKVDALSTYGG